MPSKGSHLCSHSRDSHVREAADARSKGGGGEKDGGSAVRCIAWSELPELIAVFKSGLMDSSEAVINDHLHPGS